MKVKYLMFLFFFTQCKQEPSEVTGVITYYFNKNFGDKPDIGAKVYLINEKKKVDHSSIDSFINITMDKHLYESLIESSEIDKLIGKDFQPSKSSIENRNKEIETLKQKLASYNVETDDKYKLLDNRSASQLYNLVGKSDNVTTVDGSGRFNLKVPSGEYTSLIISNGRKGNTVTTIGGLVSLESIKLSSGEKKEINHAFGMQ